MFIPPSPFTASDVVYTTRLAFGSTANVGVGTATKIALAIFDGNPGQRVSVKVVPGPISALSLYRPNQTVLAQHSTGILTTLMEPPLLPAAGTYQFLLDPTGNGTGTTGLTLYDVPPDVTGTITATQAGTSVGVKTTVPGQNARLTFTGTTGDRVSVRISNGADATVYLRNPDDANLASAVISVFGAFIDTTVLPADGTYSLFADYFQASTGTLTLTLHAVPADYSGTITAGGSSASVPITTPGQNGSLTFSGTATHRVSLYVTGGNSASIALKKPDGTTQASITTGGFTAFMEPQTLATTDTYAITVDPSGSGTGTFTVTLYDVPADTTDSVSIGGAAATVSLSPGQNGSVTFNGTSGQQVTVRMTNNTIGIGGFRGSTTVRLYKPDGNLLTSTTSSALNFTLSTQTLPASGTYTIVVDPSSANAGSINVAVTNP